MVLYCTIIYNTHYVRDDISLGREKALEQFNLKEILFWESNLSGSRVPTSFTSTRHQERHQRWFWRTTKRFKHTQRTASYWLWASQAYVGVSLAFWANLRKFYWACIRGTERYLFAMKIDDAAKLLEYYLTKTTLACREGVALLGTDIDGIVATMHAKRDFVRMRNNSYISWLASWIISKCVDVSLGFQRVL